MHNIPPDIKNYIKKRTSLKWKLFPQLNKKYEIIVVVPVLAEYENLKVLVESLELCDKVNTSCLVIFVVNNVENASITVKENNDASYKYLLEKITQQNEYFLDFAVVDAYSKNLTLKTKNGGVGLARKIGMDLALGCFDYNTPLRKALVCLDADCTVSSNYFDRIKTQFINNNFDAAYLNYNHPLPEDEEKLKAIICYEIFLRFYLLGLSFAGSRFAIQTIGSTMICSPEAYVKVGGMNKRKAAEDFYFMEALAKNYDVHMIKDAFVYPSSRGSWRVPFGTGQRVNRFLEKKQNEYLLYSIKSFKILKEWNTIYLNKGSYSPEELMRKAELIDKHLFDFLSANNFLEDWRKIFKNSKHQDQIDRQKTFWFDGFRTLKLIHYLKDTAYPQQQMFDAVDELLKLFNFASIPSRESNNIPGIETQKRYLSILRNLTNSLT